MLELSQLGCFVAAAEELHFGRAAVRLNMTQPTLSRQIQALERELRVLLFERNNRTVKLTMAGRVFFPEARRILALADTATNWTRRAWQGESGVIRLGFVASSAFADVPRVLASARAELPDVRILLKEGTSANQKEALLADMLDVALLRPPIDRTKFGAMFAREDEFIAALHKDDDRAAKPILSVQDFDQRDFITYTMDGAGYSYAMLSSLFDREGISPIITHQLDQNHSILSLVGAGMGAALVPQALTRLHFDDVVFRRIDFAEAVPLETYMLWRPVSDNPALPAFLKLCEALFSEGRGEGPA